MYPDFVNIFKALKVGMMGYLNVLQNTRYLTQNAKGLMFWDEKGQLLAQYEPEKAGQCQ